MIHAVFMFFPPKAMLVTNGSLYCASDLNFTLPLGEIVLMPLLIKVATQTSPFACTASEP